MLFLIFSLKTFIFYKNLLLQNSISLNVIKEINKMFKVLFNCIHDTYSGIPYKSYIFVKSCQKFLMHYSIKSFYNLWSKFLIHQMLQESTYKSYSSLYCYILYVDFPNYSSLLKWFWLHSNVMVLITFKCNHESYLFTLSFIYFYLIFLWCIVRWYLVKYEQNYVYPCPKYIEP